MILLAGCVGNFDSPTPNLPGDDDGVLPGDPPPATTTPSLPGCDPLTAPITADLHGVWIAPSGAVWFAGDGGVVGRRDDAGWAWCAVAPGVALNAVWGSGDDDVWMVGDAGTILRFDGAGFTSLDADTSAALADIWGSSADEIFVVGEAGTVRRFAGDAWSSADLGAAHQIGSVWGAGGAVWIAGTVPVATDDFHTGADAEIFRWHAPDQSWTAEAAFTEGYGFAAFTALAGSGADDVWAVGTKEPAGAAAGFAFAAHYDGAAWAAVDAPENVRIHRDYTAVVADAPGDASVWVAGRGPSAVAFDGDSWSSGDAQVTADLDAIDARGATMWAVGARGKVLKWSGDGWSIDLP